MYISTEELMLEDDVKFINTVLCDGRDDFCFDLVFVPTSNL
jgi:hypothetical protein